MSTFNEQLLLLEMPVFLRLVRYDDLEKLEWYGQYRHFRAVFQRAFADQARGHRLMIIADCRDFPIGQIFVQLRSSQARIAKAGERAYLYSLRVMEMFQSMGIGTRLIQEAESSVAARGYTWTTIAAAKRNVGALRLYERLGYGIFGEDAGEWSYTDHLGIVRNVQESCWLLEKRLNAL
jgi:ribosomal protein S18 acetylase RimI-like enzyme